MSDIKGCIVEGRKGVNLILHSTAEIARQQLKLVFIARNHCCIQPDLPLQNPISLEVLPNSIGENLLDGKSIAGTWMQHENNKIG